MKETKVSYIKKLILKRKLLLFLIIIVGLLFLPVVFDSLKLNEWAEGSRPFTDNFLYLLKQKEYDELFQKYFSDSGMPLGEMSRQFVKLHEMFGQITFYEYVSSSSTSFGQFGPLTGYSMYYQIKFDSGKTCQGNFGIEIDQNTNEPVAGKLISFTVLGNLSEGEIVQLMLKE